MAEPNRAQDERVAEEGGVDRGPEIIDRRPAELGGLHRLEGRQDADRLVVGPADGT
jgi:hypothetical protein